MLLNPRINNLDAPLVARFTDRGTTISQLRSGESDSSGTLFHSPSAQESGASRIQGKHAASAPPCLSILVSLSKHLQCCQSAAACKYVGTSSHPLEHFRGAFGAGRFSNDSVRRISSGSTRIELSGRLLLCLPFFSCRRTRLFLSLQEIRLLCALSPQPWAHPASKDLCEDRPSCKLSLLCQC